MFLIENLLKIKKKVLKWYKKYFTVEGLYDCILPDKMYIKKIYKFRTGKKLDLKNPKTFNEKQNWLKLYDRRPEYTVMVDKYKSREYIAEKIGEQYLVPLLGVWDSPDEIDFDTLPNEFVLKCNHDNGIIICKDKNKLDIEKTKKELADRLSRDYYKKHREWPYKNVPRKIICEKLMENTNDAELVDFKLFCFGGIPKLIMVNSNRFGEGGTKTDMYNIEWQYMEMQDGHYPNAGDVFEKPSCFEEMCSLSKKLSEGVPFLRVDFNYWNKKLYFGELTFFHSAGVESFVPEDWNDVLGSWLIIPKKHRR